MGGPVAATVVAATVVAATVAGAVATVAGGTPVAASVAAMPVARGGIGEAWNGQLMQHSCVKERSLSALHSLRLRRNGQAKGSNRQDAAGVGGKV